MTHMKKRNSRLVLGFLVCWMSAACGPLEDGEIPLATGDATSEPVEAERNALTTCTYTISRTRIDAVTKENVADNKLELVVDTRVQNGSTSILRSFAGDIEVGSSNPSQADFFTKTVAAGSYVKHTFQINVTEKDSGLNPNDKGSTSGTIEFWCSDQSPAEQTAIINVDDGSRVDVVISAFWQ